jgi:hypothetical protein
MAEPIYADLRAQALDATRSGRLPSTLRSGALGVVVDIPASGGFVTIVALADNTTSMYTSTGGGTIGAGAHQAVATATQQLLVVVDAHRSSFDDHVDDALPPTGTVRFHGLAEAGGFVADVPEDAFWGRAPHQLMPVIAATQQLIGAISAIPTR